MGAVLFDPDVYADPQSRQGCETVCRVCGSADALRLADDGFLCRGVHTWRRPRGGGLARPETPAFSARA